MKTESEIDAALRNVDANGPSKFKGMTYEQGVDEALRWVIGEISDNEFEYAGD